MGKNKKKEYVLDAVLDEETYMAYKSGQAIDNNGLRSPKGSYWPKQPSYRQKNHIKEQLKRAGADMAVGATDYVVFGIGLPMVKRLFHEEVYPFLSGKVHSWLNPSKTKATIKATELLEAKVENTNVINLSDYRKQA